MRSIYKTLVNVFVMHEYYLSDWKGNTVFDLPLQIDRVNYVMTKCSGDMTSINDHIKYVIPQSQIPIFQNYGIQLCREASGFKLVVEVIESILPDGTIAYTPRTPFPANINLQVLIVSDDYFIESVSNTKIEAPIPGAYYFSNENTTGVRTFPALTSPISARGTSKYEQGELTFSVGAIGQFYYDNSTPPKPKWLTITGTNFANENDRCLVPLQFNYQFNNSDNITNAVFNLKDNTGTIVYTNTLSSTGLLNTVSLDFSNATLATVPLTSPSIGYTLVVTGTNGYSRQFNLVFMDSSIDATTVWGMVNIIPQVTNTSFNLLDASNNLITRQNPDGTYVEAPVYEISVKSKFVVWRYMCNQSGINLQAPAGNSTILFTDKNGNIETLVPRGLTYSPAFVKGSGSNYTNIPSPDTDPIISIETQRIYKDIYVGQTTLFTNI